MNETLDFGQVSVARIEEMHGSVGMTAEQFFPGWPSADWDANHDLLVPDHFDPQDRNVRTAMQSWLLRSEGKTILIDCGIGNDKSRPAIPSWDHLRLGYLDHLAAAGVRPEDVDVVVNTHLHLDHIGWNTRLVDGQWVPTFPKATYLMPAIEVQHWNRQNNPGVNAGVNQNAYEDSVEPILRADQAVLWEGAHRLDGNLTLEAAPGHTPGSSVVKLQSGHDRALFAGDILHTPLQLLHPEHSSCFCEDPVVAETTRRRLLGWASDETALVLPAHLSGHSAFEVNRHGERFELKGWAPLAAY